MKFMVLFPYFAGLFSDETGGFAGVFSANAVLRRPAGAAGAALLIRNLRRERPKSC
jgi:hypothetical protein